SVETARARQRRPACRNQATKPTSFPLLIRPEIISPEDPPMVHLRTSALISAVVAMVASATPASAFFYATGDHSLRAGPGGLGSVTGSVAEGQRLGVISCRDNWCL